MNTDQREGIELMPSLAPNSYPCSSVSIRGSNFSLYEIN